MRNLRIEAETEWNGCLCDGLTDKNGEHHYFCSGEHGERGGIVAGYESIESITKVPCPWPMYVPSVTPASPPTCNRLADSAPKLAP
jgi:hypothetical protein